MTGLTRSIKAPIPEITEACWHLAAAVDAHVGGDAAAAASHFRAADCRAVWGWVNPAWSRPDLNVRIKTPVGDSAIIPKPLRDPDRGIVRAVKKQVLDRDGFRCRYCGIPVVSADVRKLARKLYPDAVRWVEGDPSRQHAGFQCLWLQYDHVVPHSHGGRSTPENVVISCALCNFGKDRYTLAQLGLEDPRLRPPEPTDWDGLERLLAFWAQAKNRTGKSTAANLITTVSGSDPASTRSGFFIPGAWINKGYVYTAPIAGKARWFAIGSEIHAEPVVQDEVEGVRLICSIAVFERRGMPLPTPYRMVR